MGYIEKQKALFIATNRDENAMVGGRYKIGAGPIVQTILTACNEPGSTSERQAPDVTIGKPFRYAYDTIIEEKGDGVSPKRTLMIGDKIETDIKFGQNCGIDQALVMTGVTKTKE
jgi:ribonucleotide monophosphatase NagD (HAD superfamily)